MSQNIHSGKWLYLLCIHPPARHWVRGGKCKLCEIFPPTSEGKSCSHINTSGSSLPTKMWPPPSMFHLLKTELFPLSRQGATLSIEHLGNFCFLKTKQHKKDNTVSRWPRLQGTYGAWEERENLGLNVKKEGKLRLREVTPPVTCCSTGASSLA